MLDEICVNMVNGESIYWTKRDVKKERSSIKQKWNSNIMMAVHIQHRYEKDG